MDRQTQDRSNDYAEWYCDSVFTEGMLLTMIYFTITCRE